MLRLSRCIEKTQTFKTSYSSAFTHSLKEGAPPPLALGMWLLLSFPVLTQETKSWAEVRRLFFFFLPSAIWVFTASFKGHRKWSTQKLASCGFIGFQVPPAVAIAGKPSGFPSLVPPVGCWFPSPSEAPWLGRFSPLIFFWSVQLDTQFYDQGRALGSIDFLSLSNIFDCVELYYLNFLLQNLPETYLSAQCRTRHLNIVANRVSCFIRLSLRSALAVFYIHAQVSYFHSFLDTCLLSLFFFLLKFEECSNISDLGAIVLLLIFNLIPPFLALDWISTFTMYCDLF